MRIPALALVIVSLVACAGKVTYIPPSAPTTEYANSIVVDRAREDVWNDSVPELGKRYFVINNLDKSSGLINVSYSGDPEQYIDCGNITSFVSNARGERTYNFAGAKAQQTYEIMNSSGLFFIDRKMALEGRVNLIFEEVSPSRTRVTANTRYVVRRQSTVRTAMSEFPRSNDDSIAFNAGGSGSFNNGDGSTTDCVATGELEQEILSAIKR